MGEIIKKSIFLQNLPYLKGDIKEQQFISDLILDENLAQIQQNILLDYFDVTNSHWKKWNGESTFRIWFLFTNPESCNVFNKELLEQARIDIIPDLTKWSIGDMINNIEEYSKRNPIFAKLYNERKKQEEEDQRQKTTKTKEISGYKINLLKKLQQIIIDVSFPGVLIEFTKKEYEILMQGYYSKTMEEKWNIIPKGNILHFCRSWTGDEIFRAEILYEKCKHGDYKIHTFYVDREKVNENFLEYMEFIFYSLIVLIYWCILKRDVRHLIMDKYGQGEKGAIFLWSEFGNMLFTDKDYDEADEKINEIDT